MTLWPNGLRTMPTVSSAYGPRPVDVSGASSIHRGTDFIGFSYAHAVDAGEVTVVGTLVGWAGGIMVWVEHDGYLTRNLHLASTSVRTGQKVSAGEVLGVVGATGTASGVHLHLEVAVSGTTVDPVPFLRSRVSLTPPMMKMRNCVMIFDSEYRIYWPNGYFSSYDKDVYDALKYWYENGVELVGTEGTVVRELWFANDYMDSRVAENVVDRISTNFPNVLRHGRSV